MSKRASSSRDAEQEDKARRRSDDSHVDKRAKIANDILEELTCPLTLELCADPVTAEDGHLYEKTAIASYFEHCRRASLRVKSPVNNVTMGTTLTPALHACSIIERVLTSGALSRTDVAARRQHAFDIIRVQPLMKRVGDGQVGAMLALGILYSTGDLHVKKNYKAAFEWFCKGSDLGNASCTGMKGIMLCDGVHCEKDVTQGLVDLAFSAGNRSRFSNFMLGLYYERGNHGLRKDDKAVRHWYNRVANPTKYNLLCDASDDNITHARKWLDEHPEPV